MSDIRLEIIKHRQHAGYYKPPQRIQDEEIFSDFDTPPQSYRESDLRNERNKDSCFSDFQYDASADEEESKEICKKTKQDQPPTQKIELQQAEKENYRIGKQNQVSVLPEVKPSGQSVVRQRQARFSYLEDALTEQQENIDRNTVKITQPVIITNRIESKEKSEEKRVKSSCKKEGTIYVKKNKNDTHILEKELLLSRAKVSELETQNLALIRIIEQVQNKAVLLEMYNRSLQDNFDTLKAHKKSEHQQYLQSDRQSKAALLAQIDNLHSKCSAMQRGMAEQQHKFDKFVKQIEREKDKGQQQIARLVEEYQYKDKFINAFLDMLQKIKVNLDPQWSLKQRIAVGWKVVKNIVKKAWKLGVKQPSIVGRSQNSALLQN